MEGKDIRALFGQNIKNYRNRRNWSQSDLAEFANISLNYIGDIERGNKWPHPDTLSRLADALGIKVFELFTEEDMEISIKTQELMNRLIKDVSLSIEKSLSLSINQSLEHIKKQYKLG